jgi:hypothetical protein
VSNGAVQRRPAFVVLGVDVRALVQQELEGLDIAAPRGAVQRRPAFVVLGVDVLQELENVLRASIRIDS